MAISQFPPSTAGGGVAPTSENRNYYATAAGTYTVSIPAGIYKFNGSNSLGQAPYLGLTVGTTVVAPETLISTEETLAAIPAISTSLIITDGAATSWGARSDGLTNNTTDFAFGNSTYVASGNSGQIATSTDLITWTTRTNGFGASNVNTTAFGAGVFVAGGAGAFLQSSTDGITWTTRTSGFGTSNINKIRFGGDLFVAVGAGGAISTSTDGITWTARTSNTASAFNDVAYGNGRYVAVGSVTSTRNSATSTNGITWTTNSTGISETANAVAFGNGVFIVVTNNSASVRVSTNGTTWTSVVAATANGNGLAIAYGGGYFAMYHDDSQNRLVYSTDGTTWTNRTQTQMSNEVTLVSGGVVTNFTPNNYNYVNGYFLGSGANLFFSPPVFQPTYLAMEYKGTINTL